MRSCSYRPAAWADNLSAAKLSDAKATPASRDLCGLDFSIHLFPTHHLLPVNSGAQQGENQHEEGSLQQSSCCGWDGFGSFGKQGEPSVNEFNVDPVNEQGSLA